VILEGKTVIVSGVGPGLGGAVARCAVRDGANVVIAARGAAKLDAIAKELDPSGRRVAAHAFDITSAAACDGLAALAEQRFGGVDALIQVAALDAVFGTLETTTPDDWRRVMEVNVIGSTQLCRSVVPALKRRGGGAIVLMSAMFQMAVELGPAKIRVNTVIPTWMWGPPVQNYVKWQAKQQSTSEEAVIAHIAKRFPMREIPPDDDVAEVAVLFASDRTRMVTGQYLRVDAGEKLG
jgi:NAD(P)-dependent dehydrogenase (short-subunit alcohol dehydrogenase family)